MRIPRPQGTPRELRRGWIYALGGLLLLLVLYGTWCQLQAAATGSERAAIPVRRAPSGEPAGP